MLIILILTLILIQTVFVSANQSLVKFNKDNRAIKGMALRKDENFDVGELTSRYNYKSEVSSEEEIDYDILNSDAANELKTSNILEGYGRVDNSRPITQIYFDNEDSFQPIDTYIVLDSSLDLKERQPIKDAVNDLNNDIRLLGLDAKTFVWGLGPMESSKNVNISRHTGLRYPPTEFLYDEDGYSGQLARTKVVNDSYREDRGEYVSTTDSKSVTDTLISYAYIYYDRSGNIINSYSPANPTIEYNKDGYSGTLTKYNVILVDTSYNYYPDGHMRTKIKKFIGYYTGTVNKTVMEWVSDWYTINDYTGYYQGNVSKAIKEEFEDNYRIQSDKYVVFVTDDKIVCSKDLSMLKELAECESYLIASQPIGDLQFLETNHFNEGWSKFLEILSAKYSENQRNTVLLGQQFNLTTFDYDLEGDPILVEQKQLIHNPDIYDNNTGLTDGAFANYSIDNYNSNPFPAEMSFSDKGHYTIYRRIKDAPLYDPEQGLFSNEASLDIYAHQRPEATLKINWQYNSKDDLYTLDFVDLSYDPDYQYSREDKGIIKNKITYTEESKKYYKFPQELAPGSYDFEYMVQDIDCAWSLPFNINLILDEDPKLQVRYEIQYLCEGKTIYQESFEEVIAFGQIKTRVFEARDFKPAYELVGAKIISAHVDQDNPVASVIFEYKKIMDEPDIKIGITANKMREDGTIASGYGFGVNVEVDNVDTSSLKVEVEWLEKKKYQWVYGENYEISNKYLMEQEAANRYMLTPNLDSSSRARLIFIPVELMDGNHLGSVLINNIRQPEYKVDENGNIFLEKYSYTSKRIPFTIKIKGTMYENLNIIS